MTKTLVPLPTYAVDQGLRYVTPTVPQLMFRRNKEAIINDRNDIDSTGATDMATAINAYLTEYKNASVTHVFFEPNKSYLVKSTMTVPTGLHIDGGGRQGVEQGVFATIKGDVNSGAYSIITAGDRCHIEGVCVDMRYSASSPGLVGINLNANDYVHVSNCWLSGFHTADTAIYSLNGVLYPDIERNIFNTAQGVAIDLHLNAGWISKNLFFASGPGGICAVRAKGNGVISKNSFEMAIVSGSTTGQVSIQYSTTFQTMFDIIDNYVEMGGSTACIFVSADGGVGAVNVRLAGNQAYPGGSAVAGGAFFVCNSTSVDIWAKHNKVRNFETGFKNITLLAGSAPGNADIGPNEYFGTTTWITWGSGGVSDPPNVQTNTTSNIQHGQAFMQDGGVMLAGGGLVEASNWDTTTSSSLNVGAASYHYLAPGSARNISAVTGKNKGRRFQLHATDAFTTLTNSVFNVREGADVLLQSGEVRQFYVDRGSVIHEVGPRDRTGSATWNPPDLASGAQQTTTVTATGCVLGDRVKGISFSLDQAGTIFTGYVSAADTVTVTQRNDTGGNVNLGSGTLRVWTGH